MTALVEIDSQAREKPTMSSERSLILLDGVTKVFYTDEVGTHALSGIHLAIESGGCMPW